MNEVHEYGKDVGLGRPHGPTLNASRAASDPHESPVALNLASSTNSHRDKDIIIKVDEKMTIKISIYK